MTALNSKFFYDPLEKKRLNQQQIFIETLYHDNKNGFLTRMKFVNKKTIKYSSRDCKTMESYEKNCDTYISLNGFSKPDKNSKNLRNINCLYFDLDCHDKDQNYIDTCIKNTYKMLGRAIKENYIPKPTMITESGRGLGLFYVLKHSIANTENTVKSINFWKVIYKCLFQKLKDMLSNAYCVLEPDSTSICDVARIVRMPLTTNTNNGRICKLVRVEKSSENTPLFYDLSELNEYTKDMKAYPDKKFKSKRPHKFENKKVVNFNAYKFPFLTSLMEKLERLQDKFNAVCTNKRRELMCFYYYNAAKQVLEDARIRLYVFNEGFNEPLDEKELEHVIKSVNSNKPASGDYEGYYKIKNSTIIEKLDLTDEEINYCGFCGSLKIKKREEKKIANRLAKEKRNADIISMIIEHPELTYEYIAETFHVSLRTLKNIAAQAGIKRYNLKTDSEGTITSKKGGASFEIQKCKKMPISLGRGVSKGEKREILTLIKGSISFLKATLNNKLGNTMNIGDWMESEEKSRYIKNNKIMNEMDRTDEKINTDRFFHNNEMNIFDELEEELLEEQLKFDVG